CKHYFTMEEDWNEFLRMWQLVTALITEQEFITQWDKFLKRYESKLGAIKYLQEIWMPYKECFVSAWTENYLHLGNKVTSCVEAAHAALKRCLQLSVDNLKSVHCKIVLQIESQAREICAQISYERMKWVKASSTIPNHSWTHAQELLNLQWDYYT
ncbi:12304_t:CDS:2, partial [Cetraspora pellucida]